MPAKSELLESICRYCIRPIRNTRVLDDGWQHVWNCNSWCYPQEQFLGLQAEPLDTETRVCFTGVTNQTRSGPGSSATGKDTEMATGRSRAAKAATGAKKAAAKQAAAPKAPKEPKPIRYCQCGCGTETKKDFAPGHDARVKGILIKAFRAGEKAKLLDNTAVDPMEFAKSRGWEKYLTPAKPKPAKKAVAKAS